MTESLDQLSLSRTFKMVDGHLVDLHIADRALGEASASASAPLVGTIIDSKFKVLSLMGQGGMGSVYRARHLQLDKEVALKTFRSAQVSPDDWMRFQREAQAIAKLNHANIIQVFDFGLAEHGFPYYTMELLEGESLSSRLKRLNRLSGADVLAIFSAVAAGMAHAHRQGIVHRDIKPANIFLEEGKGPDTAKIVDFGLAKLAVAQSFEKQSMTATGLIFGSPLYMSPEQASGLETDSRTDIYSFGCSLFHALTGSPPFVGNSALAVMSMHQERMLPKLAQAAPGTDFPPELDTLMAKLLAKSTDRRYQTFEEVERGLARSQAAFSRVSRPDERVSGKAQDRAIETPKEETTGQYTGEQGRRSRSQTWLFTAVCLAVLAPLSLGALYVIEQTARSRGTQIRATAPVSSAMRQAKPASKRTEEALNEALTTPAAPPGDYFSHPAGGGAKRFDFPSRRDDLGEIECLTALPLPGSEFASGPARRAADSIFVPAGTLVLLTCRDGLSNNPELFRKFHSDDIYMELPSASMENGKIGN